MFRWIRTNIKCIRRQSSFTNDSTYSHQYYRIISDIYSSEISSSFCSRIEQSSFDSCIIRSLHSWVCSFPSIVNLNSLPFLSSSRYSFDAAINHPARTFGYTINAVATFTAFGLFLSKLFSNGLHSNLLPFSLR